MDVAILFILMLNNEKLKYSYIFGRNNGRNFGIGILKYE
jgi:hypothetical protein